MNLYGCHSDNVGTQPRGRTTKTIVQNGWKLTQGPGFISREPVMRIVITGWLPMKCGHIRQAGKGKDQLCAGCANEKERANV